MRLVAVLGYSHAGRDRLHPVCAARLARGRDEAQPDDVVLLSGSFEADVMALAWDGAARRVFVDRGARSTAGNAIGIARAARVLGVGEVVLVTSSWHGRRAAALVRFALRGSEVRVRLAPSADPAPPRARLREVACWSVTPVVALAASRAAR